MLGPLNATSIRLRLALLWLFKSAYLFPILVVSFI
jgi:hypothetical protein